MHPDAAAMLLTNLPRHHSAEVHLWLITEHGAIRLAQIGPDYVIVADPLDLPPCKAEIVMRADNHELRWPVRLVEGIRATDLQTAVNRR